MIKKLVLLAALSVAAGPALRAQTALKLTGAGPVNDGQYYVGPYQGNLGTGTNSSNFVPGTDVSLNCVDFFHEVNIGDVWNVNVTSLTGNLANTRLGSAGLSQYEQAAYLTMQYGAGTYPDLGGDRTADIQHAIWTIMGATGYTTDGDVNFWISQATSHYQDPSVDYSSFRILTQVGQAGITAQNDSKQEFLTATPEPSSMALLGTGLIGLVPLYRRRRKA